MIGAGRHLSAAICIVGFIGNACGVRVDVRCGETLLAVRDRIRALPPSARSERIEVVFPLGDYELGGTLELGPVDGGGSADAPVVWRAVQPGKVRLTTSRRVPVGRFSKVTDPSVLRRLPSESRGKVWVADVGDIIRNADAQSIEVFINGDFGTCARWPNAGEFTSFTGKVDCGTCTGKLFENGAFVYSNPRAKRWDFSKGVRLFGYWTHDWHGESATARFYGTENGTTDVIRLSTGIYYGINSGTWGRDERRFYAYDLLEELDAPREWWIDRETKKLFIIPDGAGFREKDRVVLAAKSSALLAAKGLKNFVLDGFFFEGHNGVAVSLVGTENVRLEKCGFAGICGDTAVYGSAAVCVNGRNCSLLNCQMRHLGAAGIRLEGGDRKRLVRSDNLVQGCKILDFGVRRRTYHGAIEAEGCGHVIRGNEFAYAPHHAMRYETNETLIENNDVHHVLLETGDAGAIYTGRDCTTQGNVVRNNFIHELGTMGADNSTMGLYFDDCDCGDAVYGNVFWKCARGIMLGGGRDHPIVGNVFAECNVGLSIDYRGHTWKCFYQMKPGMDDCYQPSRMAAMNVSGEPWKSRYPRLARQMEDSPEEPLYNPVVSNVFLDCGSQLVALDGKEMDAVIPKMTFADNLVIVMRGTKGCVQPDERIRKSFHIETNVVNTGFVDAKAGNFRFEDDSNVKKRLPGLDLGERWR